MDPSSTTSTPWRVLEEPAAAQTGDAQRMPHASSTAALTGMPALNVRLVLAIGGITLATVMGVAAFFLATGSTAGSVEVSAATGAGLAGAAGPSAQPSGAEATLVIEVSGAVVRPGVFTLPIGSRVNDAIVAAGGFGPRVDAARASRELNLAAILKDGDRILVPSRDDAPTAGPATGLNGQPGASDPPSGTGGSSGPIDLNRATVAQLDSLPGIGPVTAAKIVASRDQKPFRTIDDLRTRKLVGQKVFDGLRGLITIG